MSDRFNLSMSTVHGIIVEVTSWLCTICPAYIRWPHLNTEKQRIASEFKKRCKLPEVIGCIDGSHIPIRAPIENKIDYFNRKKFYSIILQGVVDSRKRFIDIFFGEPGSLHDFTVYQRSDVFKKAGEACGNFYMLGDSAYVCSKSLICPFKNIAILSRQQKDEIAKARVTVEHAFGLLKKRWRRLQYFENLNIPLIINCVVACCVLLNVQIDYESNNDS